MKPKRYGIHFHLLTLIVGTLTCGSLLGLNLRRRLIPAVKESGPPYLFYNLEYGFPVTYYRDFSRNWGMGSENRDFYPISFAIDILASAIAVIAVTLPLEGLLRLYYLAPKGFLDDS